MNSWCLYPLPLLLMLAGINVRADVLDAVNAARTRGCEPHARPALRDDARLRRAAQRMAGGATLHAALSAAGYAAAESSAVHVSGAASDAELQRILTANYCATLSDGAITEVGALKRGHDTWLVLAAPAFLPSSRDAADIRREILDLVNAARRHGRRCGQKSFGAAPPLALRDTLTRAAHAHSQDMAHGGVFEHRGRDGSSPAARVARAGYGPYSVVGENIAAGAMTPAEVTNGWLASPPHCENIMDRRFADIGIAFDVNTATAELVYWTQDFAAPSPNR